MTTTKLTSTESGQTTKTDATKQAPKYSGKNSENATFPLSKTNFILMGISGLMIIVGFLLMCGDGSTMENFNPDIFSTRRIVIGPAIAFIGFVCMAFGIIYRSKKEINE